MELKHLIELISELTENSEFKYVRGENTCTYLGVDVDEPRVYAKTYLGEDKSWAPSFLQELADKIQANMPFNISSLLNNKGSFRPVIEAIIAHTSEFYWVKYRSQIMVVWRPDTPHKAGNLEQCNIEDVLDPSSTDVLVVNESSNEKLDIDSLIQILKGMYSKQKVAGIHMFGIKYGKYLDGITAQEIISKAGLPDSYFVELNKGKALYRAMVNNDFGVRFYSPILHVTERLNNANHGPLQCIYYGAPGTGKSYKIDTETDKYPNRSIRITFHPDSDYASFVGAYKPTMENVPMSMMFNTSKEGSYAEYLKKTAEHPGTEKKIVYKYVPQAFLKAYVAAWSDLSQPYFLVIEEINRGNCAQIFGDLFQLLDRNNMGSSSYDINADEDIAQFLSTDKKAFAGLTDEQKNTIEHFVLIKDNGTQKAIGEDILNGSKLLLPPNLYIWATMNTSDQSLFPIDSAFKRRWNWKYVPIDYDKEDWVFAIGDNLYSWGEFLKKINPIISKLTDSADKQIGYYFAKPDERSDDSPVNDIISQDIFLNKVLFYLWTDVLKDFDAGEEPFINSNTSRAYEFSDFFNEEQDFLQEFIDKLELENLAEYSEDVDDNTGYSLSIKWPNGEVLSLPSKNETYLQAIERIGVERAAEALAGRYRMKDVPLISKTKSPKVETSKQYKYAKIGEYYVMTGIDNHGSVLRLLSDKFDLGLEVAGE